ncbi:MAG: phosphatase PAP2 family protein [Clostridia bacterium]|nr:phosphatase PAP2 family protein [Clostridia bacterium]
MILFDLPVYQFIMSMFTTSSSVVTLMSFFTSFGSTLVIVSGILCVAILYKNKKYFFNFLSACLIGTILNNLIKIIVRRPRPTNTMPFTYESSYSFPSGHTMMSTIFYGLIIYYVYKNMKNKKLKTFIICILSLIIFMVGLSRVYLGVHYATDVLGGYIFGIIYLVVFIRLMNKFENRKLKNK